jgi:aminobenzoyl-glutamate utilization protein B
VFPVNHPLVAVFFVAVPLLAQAPPAAARAPELKAELGRLIDAERKRVQVMVDTVYSFAELGFEERETSRYLSTLLEKEGFKVERGVAGIPTAWVATWGSGKPVISLGSDIDDVPSASQRPGIPWHDPLVEGAPGHGEGHNSGVPMNIVAAMALKRVMEREHLSGTLQLWPGVCEEAVGGKAHLVRAGVFKDVDAVLFAHIGTNFEVSWGPTTDNGVVSIEYMFHGRAAHAAGSPWRGRSALDAVELMDVGFNFRREHLRPATRIHNVITLGGAQPNVVPQESTVWYYLREADYEHIQALWKIADEMAQGAALMTGTTFTSRVLGSAWPGHFNRPLAEAMRANIESIGLPAWSEDDQAFAKALQHELKQPEKGLPTKLPERQMEKKPDPDAQPAGGASDDIGDVSWNAPTITLYYPANIQGGPGHSWADGAAMATPIAHKGVVAGAKAQAFTALDLLLKPELVSAARDYFRNVQTKQTQYKPLIREGDQPALWLNRATDERWRPLQKPFYYNASKYETYLEQLGVHYPTLSRPK